MTDDKPKPRCGAKDIETPRWDPYRETACTPHDNDMQAIIDGEKSHSVWVTARNFTTSATIVFLKSLYAVTLYPAYLLIGGLGGAVRQWYLERQAK